MTGAVAPLADALLADIYAGLGAIALAEGITTQHWDAACSNSRAGGWAMCRCSVPVFACAVPVRPSRLPKTKAQAPDDAARWTGRVASS